MGNNKRLFTNMIILSVREVENSWLVSKRNTFSKIFLIWGSLLCFSIDQRVPGLKKVEDPCYIVCLSFCRSVQILSGFYTDQSNVACCVTLGKQYSSICRTR